MTRPRLRRTPAAAAAASLCLVVACERAAPPPRVDSVAPAPPVARVDSVAPQPAPPGDSAWDAESTGPALFVPGDTTRPANASAVLPDSTVFASDSAAAAAAALGGVAVELFAPSGQVGAARVQAARGEADECAVGPAVRLDGAPPPSWKVAFAAGRARPIAVDSIEGLARADSAARTAEVARLASLVPRTNAREFKGLPFVVRQARGFTEGGVDVLVGEVVRKVGQEAKPREQHLLVVGERARAGGARYELAYHELSAGDEFNVETRALLAAVRLGTARRPTLVLNRESPSGLSYALLERVGPRRWRVRWTSGTLGCEAVGE
jgi:hypothetical protein